MIRHVIRLNAAGAVLAAAEMEETRSGFRTPRDANGHKCYTLQTTFWNADTLRKTEEYKLLNSSVGLYMWGRDKALLLASWREQLTPRYPNTPYDPKVKLLLPEAEGKSWQPVES